MKTFNKSANIFRLVFPFFVVVLMAVSACGTLQIETEPLLATAEPVAQNTQVAEPLPADTVTAELTPVPTATPAEVVAGDAASTEDGDVETRPAEISTLDDTWLQYTNYELGFSINFPKTMVHFYGSCKWNEENSDHSYRPDPAFVPVEIFEDGDTVYIANAYYHELTGETKETDANGGTRTFFSDCQAVTNTLELLQDPENRYQTNVWAIETREVQGDEELDAFIKARYGEGCSLGEMEPSHQDGVFDVSVLGDGKSLDQTLCPLNYGTVVKYYPDANRVVAWNTGQAYTFAADANNTVTYDQEMIDSFRFLTGGSPGSEASGYDYSGWQQYTNEAVGYSLMIPADAEIVSLDPSQRVAFIGPEVDGKPRFQIMIEHYVPNLPAETDFLQTVIEEHRAYLDSLGIDNEGMIEEVTFAGESAIRTKYLGTSEIDPPRDDFNFMHGDKIFRISITHFGDSEVSTLYDQFLQSIAFE